MNLAANIEISLNQQPVRIPREISLQKLLKLKNVRAERGVAVAVNGSVVPKEDWSSTVLRELDQIVIITATQGG